MGFIIIFMSGIFFAMSAYFTKIVTNITSMSGVISSFSRYFIGAIIMFIYIIVTKKTFKSKDFKPVIWRSVFNSLSIVIYTAALGYTTMTNATMLKLTYPVFVVLLVPLMLKGESIKKSTYLYLFLIMLGSYIVADPSFGNINKGDLLSLIAAVVAAISIIYLKKARENNDGYLIVFYVMFIGVFVNIPFSINDLVNFEVNGLIYVIFSALLGILGQVFLTWGFKYTDPATGSLISSSRIVLSAIIGIVFLNEPFNIRIVIGMVLIFGSLVGLSGYFDTSKVLIDDEIEIK